eukprot:jgi/Chrzof1/11623/Cz06g02190.t1
MKPRLAPQFTANWVVNTSVGPTDLASITICKCLFLLSTTRTCTGTMICPKRAVSPVQLQLINLKMQLFSLRRPPRNNQ